MNPDWPWYVSFVVAVGGGLGAILRVNISRWLMASSDANSWPWGTFYCNLMGALLLGGLTGMLQYYPAHWLFAFWELGVLGGFTTMSAFSLEAVQLWRNGNQQRAFYYAVLTAFACIGALTAGYQLGALL